MSISFKQFSLDDLRKKTSVREKEIKFGSSLVEISDADIVILGIKEDIGPKANFGLTGAQNAFEAFLSKFLNMQLNRYTDVHKVCVFGEIIACPIDLLSIQEMREYVAKMDAFLEKIVHQYLRNHQILIVVGGGHNNAYPIIKTLSQGHGALNVINLDPHADYRPMEGRHSGNSFTYAFKNGYMNKYSVLGLHKYYNSENILSSLDDDGHYYSFFEDWLDHKRSLEHDIGEVIQIYSEKENKVGIELDLDSISFMPSSAFSSSGLSVESAREYLRYTSRNLDVAYLHLTEGAPNNNISNIIVGKTLAYLVLDFITEKKEIN